MSEKNVREVMEKFETKLQAIYDKRTAGSHTWFGVLSQFATEYTNAVELDTAVLDTSLRSVAEEIKNMEIPEGVEGEKAEGFRMARYRAANIAFAANEND